MTESQQFLLSAFLALLIEFSVLGILGHKRQIQQEPAFFAETELLEMPKKLVSEKKTTNKNPALRIKPTQNQGNKLSLETSNALEEGASPSRSHGPIPLHTPTPTIPARFHEKDLHQEAIIEFRVDTQGHATAKLRRSTGEKELDTLALETAWKWRFQPAEKDGNPVESKFLVKMLFEVK
jgi:protein TonB